jgi:phosphoribosylanthranilate isomerase
VPLYDAKPAADAPLPGGNGFVFDWWLAQAAATNKPWLLSCGLDDTNLDSRCASAAQRESTCPPASRVRAASKTPRAARLSFAPLAARRISSSREPQEVVARPGL